jgi:hypothetical protein
MRNMSKFFSVFRSSNDRISGILLFLFIFINTLVFINAVLHSPTVGYDMQSHQINVEKLSQLSWPSNLESPEFFSPPLPYVIPALAFAIGDNIWWALKIGQLCNVLLSLGTTYYLLIMCENVLPGQTWLKIFALGLMGMLPVYYKTFSQIRGETYLVFLALLTTEFTNRIFIRKEFSFCNTFKLGLGLGALVLARQWGFLLFPAIFLCGLSMAVADAKNRVKIIKALSVAAAISAITGGWFYAYLFNQYGTILAFNRTQDNESKPLSFYIGSGNGKLFIDPIRPNFIKQAIPILYSEMWGDYWAYFSVYMIDTRSNTYMGGRGLETETLEKNLSKWAITNRFKFGPYLGRINLISILPTSLLIIGGIYGQVLAIQALRDSSDRQKVLLGLTSNIVTVTLLGYLWFVIRYPTGSGDTLKTTYILQIFPFLAIQTGMLIQKIRAKQIWYILALVLTIITIHNLPAMVTRFIELPWQVK